MVLRFSAPRRRWLVGAFLLACWAAGAGASGQAPVHLELYQPSSSFLVGGTNATLDWGWPLEATENQGILEWEAFLSLDGGRSYPYRITPHLDLGVRRITWTVPNLASDDVRLLLRLGDGKKEREALLPEHFRIVAQAFAPTRLVHWSRRRGESARPGEPGALVWVEGSADGRSLTTWASTELELHRSEPWLSAALTGHLQATEEEPPEVRSLGKTACQTLPEKAAIRPATEQSQRVFLPPISILRQTTRQNE